MARSVRPAVSVERQGLANNSCRLVTLESVVVHRQDQERDAVTGGFERYVMVDHLDADRLKISRWGRIADGDLPPTFYKVFRAGQVLYPTRNPHLRRTAYADFEGICGEKTLTLESNGKIEPRLLPFILQTERFIEHAKSMAIGSTNPHVRWRDIAAYEFSLPPLPEQRRIAEILWSAEDVCESWQTSLNSMISLIESLNGDWFGTISPQNSGPPKGTTLGNLSDLVQIDPPKPHVLDSETNVSFVPMASVKERGGLEKLESRQYREVCKGFTAMQEGDILFPKITPCMENGKGAIACGLENGVGFGSTEFFVFRVKEPTDLSFVYFLTMSNSFRRCAARWMRGSAGQQRVPKSFFSEHSICIPPKSRRDKIGAILSNCDRARLLIESQIVLAKHVKHELLNTLLGMSNAIQ